MLDYANGTQHHFQEIVLLVVAIRRLGYSITVTILIASEAMCVIAVTLASVSLMMTLK